MQTFHTLPVVLGLAIREGSITVMALCKLDFLSTWFVSLYIHHYNMWADHMIMLYHGT